MRIERLDLTRYGRFSDYAIDFGARPETGSDFHVVFGLNEAGKSTAAAAILDLLFGIGERSPYGVAKGRASVPNWHAYNAMRIGARLELNGATVEVARLKRDKASPGRQGQSRLRRSRTSRRACRRGPRGLPHVVLARRRKP